MKKQKFVLLFTVFIDMVCFTMLFPVLPYYVKELQLPDVFVGICVAIFALMNFFCNPLWGGMSDRKGRKPVLLISIFITFCANILLGFVSGFISLFFARLIAGIGSSNISVAQAYMADISKPEERTKNMGSIGAMFGIGFVVGPFIGGVLKDWSGEGSASWVGLGAAALNILNLACAYFFLKESNQQIDKTKKRNFNPFSQIIFWLRQPVFKQLIWLFFLYVVAFSIMQITCGLLWKEKYGLTIKETTYVFAFFGISSAIFQGFLVGPLSKLFSSRQLIIGGSLIMGVALAAIPLPPKDYFIPWELIACTVLSFGNACITPSISSWLSKIAPPVSIGQVLGANQSFSSLARVIGPPLGTSIFSAHHNLPFYLSGLIMILPLGIILKLKNKV
ncbi:MAG: MFS transporter [Chitinophagaceae bacterium]|nr:MAG: MFS transporter [Chitinophagaceae bacterium]